MRPGRSSIKSTKLAKKLWYGIFCHPLGAEAARVGMQRVVMEQATIAY